MDTPAIKSRMLEIGETGVASERRSPEYLAKFVPEEVLRWEGPIKAGGLQVEKRRLHFVVDGRLHVLRFIATVAKIGVGLNQPALRAPAVWLAMQ